MISQIIFLTIIIISLFFILNYIKINETFSNYLYPIKGLQAICAKEGLKPSFMPNSCIKGNGDFNPYSNCMCIDKNGICKKCYPEIKINKGRSTVYDPNDPLPTQ
jgi:hypothetical protein